MPLSQRQRPLYEVKANLFKGLAHPYRIRTLELLADAEEVSVAALQADTELEASHLSQHLAVLRRHRLVSSERRAKIGRASGRERGWGWAGEPGVRKSTNRNVPD